MERSLTPTNDDKIQTYVFDRRESRPTVPGNVNRHWLRTKIWQIFPSLCAYLMSYVFGIMLGWCSPVYPYLISKESELLISMDQTALIAGFLMIGNMFGQLPTPFAPIGTKYAMISGLILMIGGWVVIWQASDIYGLLISRFLIGFGNGYGSYQGREYIKQMTEPPLRDNLAKMMSIYVGTGALTAYVFGPYVSFRTFSVISLIVTIVITTFCLFLPHSPKDLVQFDKEREAKLVLHYLKPDRCDLEAEVEKLRLSLETTTIICGLDSFKSKVSWYKFLMVILLVFFQQFCGIPSTIVYIILILQKLSCDKPEILAMVYILFFIFGHVIGLFYLYKFNLKFCLLFSSIAVSVFQVLNTLILYFNINEKWNYTTYVVLILFMFFHSVGLGPLPFLLTPKLFPNTPFVSHVQSIFHSITAIVVTKVFQVLFTRYGLFEPFLMFSIVSVTGTLFIFIFIPSDLSVLSEDVIKYNKGSVSKDIK